MLNSLLTSIAKSAIRGGVRSKIVNQVLKNLKRNSLLTNIKAPLASNLKQLFHGELKKLLKERKAKGGIQAAKEDYLSSMPEGKKSFGKGNWKESREQYRKAHEGGSWLTRLRKLLEKGESEEMQASSTKKILGERTKTGLKTLGFTALREQSLLSKT